MVANQDITAVLGNFRQAVFDRNAEVEHRSLDGDLPPNDAEKPKEVIGAEF